MFLKDFQELMLNKWNFNILNFDYKIELVILKIQSIVIKLIPIIRPMIELYLFKDCKFSKYYFLTLLLISLFFEENKKYNVQPNIPRNKN